MVKKKVINKKTVKSKVKQVKREESKEIVVLLAKRQKLVKERQKADPTQLGYKKLSIELDKVRDEIGKLR